MTPGARIQATIEIFHEIETTHARVDSVISDYFKKRRYAGSKDRRAIQARVYDALRKIARLNWWTQRTGNTTTITPRLRIIADLALSEKLSPSEIEALFSGSRHCPATLNEIESQLASALARRPLTHHSDMPLNVSCEFPAWLEKSFIAAFGNRLEAEMGALNQQAPMDLRVNTVKSSFEIAASKLRDEHITALPCPYAPMALRVQGNHKMGGVTAYKDGLVEIQDEGSQLLSLMVDARPGQTVIDFCAGAGGKTLSLAALMSDHGALEGNLIACDIFSKRLDRMKPRLERAGAPSVTLKTLSSEDDPWVNENAGTADRVLLDVPCSATGIWRRDPDAKWRLQPDELEETIQTQRRILASAAQLVKPGGRLIYATCSVLIEENEDQVAWFLDHTDDFSLVEAEDIWSQCIGGDAPGIGGDAPPVKDGFMRLSPASTGTDGFFCAILMRT